MTESQADRPDENNSTGGPTRPPAANDMRGFARELRAEVDSQGVMQRIVDAAVIELEGAIGASITVLEHGRIESPVHSGDLAARVGEAERDTAEGPCVDTARTEITIRADDLRSDQRWPTFAPIAVANGVLSILSFQLFADQDSMGALNVYGGAPGVFDRDAENVGQMLAAHAAIAMSSMRTITNMRVALQSRDLIGQAKGILMERYKITDVQAFELLVAASQRGNRKLRDIADELTATGEFRGIDE